MVDLHIKNNNKILLNPRFTFDNFVVGPTNKLAYEAAKHITNPIKPVIKSNPLFLYGEVGLGKTHLIQAIAWKCYFNFPQRKILYISAEQFMYKFIKALKSNDTISFKDKFRSLDILIIDDIQFICGKENTQEEFFHTFNEIIDNNKQIVITCNKSPNNLYNIEDKIKSRLSCGLVVNLHNTTYDLRVNILKSKLRKTNMNITSCIIKFLAFNITSNIRVLEGALNKIIAHSILIEGDISLESTQLILKDLLPLHKKGINIEKIQQAVAKRYNIKVSDILSKKRSRYIIKPRQIAMHLAKNLTSQSLTDIGNKFNRDHTTVIYAIKKIKKLTLTNTSVDHEIKLITKILQNQTVL